MQSSQMDTIASIIEIFLGETFKDENHTRSFKEILTKMVTLDYPFEYGYPVAIGCMRFLKDRNKIFCFDNGKGANIVITEKDNCFITIAEAGGFIRVNINNCMSCSNASISVECTLGDEIVTASTINDPTMSASMQLRVMTTILEICGIALDHVYELKHK